MSGFLISLTWLQGSLFYVRFLSARVFISIKVPLTVCVELLSVLNGATFSVVTMVSFLLLTFYLWLRSSLGLTSFGKSIDLGT